jgi:short-subunit dehydrogenase
VETLPLDLAEPTAVQTLLAHLDGRHVDVLVNNAGLGWCSLLTDMDPDKIDEMVAVNVCVLTQMCRAVGTGMTRAGRGQILNVASVAGYVPGPYQAVYYATKAYVVSLSTSMRYELEPGGVQVSCLCPGPTSTEFHQHAGVKAKGLAQRFFMSTPSEVARAALVGLDHNQGTIFPGWKHQVLGTFSRFLPGKWTGKASLSVGHRNRPTKP